METIDSFSCISELRNPDRSTYFVHQPTDTTFSELNPFSHGDLSNSYNSQGITDFSEIWNKLKQNLDPNKIYFLKMLLLNKHKNLLKELESIEHFLSIVGKEESDIDSLNLTTFSSNSNSDANIVFPESSFQNPMDEPTVILNSEHYYEVPNNSQLLNPFQNTEVPLSSSNFDFSYLQDQIYDNIMNKLDCCNDILDDNGNNPKYEPSENKILDQSYSLFFPQKDDSQKQCNDVKASGLLEDIYPLLSASQMNLLSKYVLHSKGLCKPCAFFYSKKKDCRNGDACMFCHHEDHCRLTLKQWKRQQHKFV